MAYPSVEIELTLEEFDLPHRILAPKWLIEDIMTFLRFQSREEIQKICDEASESLRRQDRSIDGGPGNSGGNLDGTQKMAIEQLLALSHDSVFDTRDIPANVQDVWADLMTWYASRTVLKEAA